MPLPDAAGPSMAMWHQLLAELRQALSIRDLDLRLAAPERLVLRLVVGRGIQADQQVPAVHAVGQLARGNREEQRRNELREPHQAQVPRAAGRLEVGDEVVVRYDPADPERADIVGERGRGQCVDRAPPHVIAPRESDRAPRRLDRTA